MKVFNKWWQWLTILLLFYVFVAGIIIPLKPGITSVTPNRFETGDTIYFEIESYNTHFDAKEDVPELWLKIGKNHILGPNTTIPLTENKLRCRVVLPQHLPGDQLIQNATLILQSEKSGIALLPSAIFLKQGSTNASQGAESWSDKIESVMHTGGIHFPFRNILVETIRNTFFHTAIWFAMLILLICSVFHSIRYLKGPNWKDDLKSKTYTSVGIVFGLLGTATGSVWARYTWGTFWTSDVKLNMTAIALLIYLAYWVLRSSIQDPDQRARVSASYNIFAFAALIPLIFVVPRMTDSLHPGNGGNPAMGGEDLDHTLRLVFYPAILAYSLLGLWISNLYYRVEKLDYSKMDAVDFDE